MKGIKKALAAILSLAVMVSIAPQVVFAGNSDRYEKVPGMQTIVSDAQHQLSCREAGSDNTRQTLRKTGSGKAGLINSYLKEKI